MKNYFFKIFAISYIATYLARVAGEYHNPVLLYCAIAFAYWFLVIRFPVYKTPTDNGEQKKE